MTNWGIVNKTNTEETIDYLRYGNFGGCYRRDSECTYCNKVLKGGKIPNTLCKNI